MQSECGKMKTRITPNTDTFYAVPMPAEYDNGNDNDGNSHDGDIDSTDLTKTLVIYLILLF